MKLKAYISHDVAVAIGVFFLLFATAAYFNIPTPESENMKFAREYGHIAEALVKGKGFANVFGVESGPTAWMPPLFVLFLAGTFYLFGIKSVAALWVILLIKYITLAASLYALLTVANHTGYQKYKYLLVPLFLVWIFVNRGAYFRALHDDWFHLFLVCSMLSVFTTRIYRPSKSNRNFTYILAFVLPLANPVLAFSFAIVEAGIFLWHKPESSSPRLRWLQTLAVFSFLAASTLLWTYRNYKVFGTFVPIKSNLWFDFYQANFLDEDGLTTNETFIKYHPINPNEMQEKYLIEGEAQFIRGFKDLSLEWIRTHPYQLLQNVSKRAISAFLYMHIVTDLQPVKPGLLSSEDIEKLRDNKLISLRETLYWTSLTLSPSEFERQIHALDLSDESSIRQNWLAQRNVLIRWKKEPRVILRSLLLSFVPFFCLICGLAVEKIRKNPIFIIAGTIYLTYLSPYILVSIFHRYQVSLSGLQSIFIFFFICFLLEKFLPQEIRFLKPGRSETET